MVDKGINTLRPGKAIVVFSFCSILQKCMPFVLLPILTRLLSVEDYGIYSVYTAWLTIFSTVCTLNLHLGVFNNGMHRFPKEKNIYTNSMMLISTILISGCILLSNVFKQLLITLTGLEWHYILCLFIQILFQQFFNLWLAHERYVYHFKRLLEIISAYCAISILFPFLAAYLFGKNALSIILAGLIANVVLGTICCIDSTIKAKGIIKIKYIRYAVLFNIVLLPHYLSSVVLGQVDRTMINSMCGTAQVAIYSTAYTFALAFNFAVTSINSAIVPWTYEAIGRGDFKKLNRAIDILIIGCGVCLLGFILAVPEGMKIFLPEIYYEAIKLIPPIAISSFFIFLYNIFANIEFYFETKFFISISSVFAALTNVFLNYIFIPQYGYQAAAYTTGFCYGLYALFHFINVRRIKKKNPNVKPYHLKRIIFVSIAFLLAVFLVIPIYSNVLLRWILLLFLLLALWINRKNVEAALRFFFEEKS